MSQFFSPHHSKTLVFIGAGATAALGMPTTKDQTQIFRKLQKSEESKEELLKKYLKGDDLKKLIYFLDILDNDNIFEVCDKDLDNASYIYKNNDKTLLNNRILELRQEYDWNAAKKIIGICPEKKNEFEDDLILDAYSIIDKKLLTGQSLKVNYENKEELLSPSRLRGARNFLILFVNILFAARWHLITDGENSAELNKYQKFITAFDRLMQKEGMQRHQKKAPHESREFYLFSTSFVSFNFEMVFPWLFMTSHHELNSHSPHIHNHPLKLWLDFGCEHRGRKIDTTTGKIVPTLEFTESVASRENEEDHIIGTPLNRAGKFYFAHGSSNWRECPVCGRMTFYFGYSEHKWTPLSKELIPPFPIPLFSNIPQKALTQKEIEWRNNLRYDWLQCMHCGSETKASDAPMIMQTMYKSTPTSFLEEIQRNVKVSLSKATHIVLLGYTLPQDDTIWYQTFAEAIRSRTGEQEKPFCSVVVGFKGDERWLYEKDLDTYIQKHKNAEEPASWGIPAIENAISIFGIKNVRAWTGGIPQVFGACMEKDVKDLFYHDFQKWNGDR